MSQVPSLGRIVHLLTNRPDGSQDAAAAIITYVNSDGSVDLTVFRRQTAASALSKIHKEGTPEAAGSPFSWIWPSRV